MKPPSSSSAVPHPDLDTDLLAYLQTLTPAQRMARHESALELVLALRRAGENHHGLNPGTPQTPGR